MPAGIIKGEDGIARCFWGVGELEAYHDHEWGVPVADDARLYEKLCLEGFQSGLSWLTIYRKREAFRHAFRDFDPAVVARFGPRDVKRLLGDAGIVRHRGKIEAAINNARCALELIEEQGSLAHYFWACERQAPATLAKDLRARGWRFVGPTTVESFMQAMGLRNDHFTGCAARPVIERLRKRFKRP